MACPDLRDWMAQIEERGDLRRVEGANCEEEIGAAVDLYMRRKDRPALLFDQVPGFPPGYRVLANVLTAPRRIAACLGLAETTTETELVQFWRQLFQKPPALPPEWVETGPVFERVQEGASVDVQGFPAPRWHPLDGGRYLGTGCVVIVQDPDTGYVNLGTYRSVIHDERTLGLMISAGRQGRVVAEKYWARGEDCPVAISFGHDPLLLMVAGSFIPHGIGEYDLAGGIRAQPVPVVRAPRTGLPVPAHSELVVEGRMPAGGLRDEGPFGEWTGYYAGGRRPEPAVQVEAVYHRRDPIILGVIPGIPPSDNSYFQGIMNNALVWDQLEKAGIPGVQGVWGHEATSRLWITVSIKQLYPGHARQAGHVAAQCFAGGYAGRFVVVVDDDIDPTDTDRVLWALCTRADLRHDTDLMHHCWSSPLDPMSYPEGYRRFNTKMVIDACRPLDRPDFPPVVSSRPEALERILARYPWMTRDLR